MTRKQHETIEQKRERLRAEGKLPPVNDDKQVNNDEVIEVPATTPKKNAKAVRKSPVRDGVGVPTQVSESVAQPSQPTPVPRGRNQEAINEAYELPYEPPSYHFPNSADPHAELAGRELARRKLLPFIQRFRPKYVAGWVHEDICRRIERFVKQVEAGLSPRLLLMMPPRSGKLLADETLVPTPKGLRLHGDLQVGDEVFHPSGKPVRILATSDKDVADVKVTFSDGSSYYCHENHEWTLYNRMRGEWQTIETNHFLKKTRFGKGKQTTCNGRSTHQLPLVSALEYREVDFTLHPYVLGAWLGDGSAGKPCITGSKSDSEIVCKIESLGYPVSSVCEHKGTGVLTTYFSGPKPNNAGRMTLELQRLGIYTKKRIPVEYQTLTKELRLELLAGLIDTDGTTDANSRISFTTVSYELADDVMQLCEGLGFRPYMQEIQPKLSTSGIQGRKVCYVVGFQPTCEIPVALERKRVTRIAEQRRVGLVSVERVEKKRLGKCIQVDSPDGLYVIGTKMTVTHNSEISSRHTPAWILGHHPDWEIIAGSHTSSLSLSFSRYLRDVMRDPAYSAVFPDARLDPSSQSVENWNLTKGGGYLAAGVGTGITGRGAHVLLLDDLVKDMEAADSITIRDNTWEWYLSTAYTRLAPGGGVLGLMTWWHDDDWAGRIQQAMAADDGADQFEIIRYPAINDQGDEFILPDDTIVQYPPGSPPPPEGSRLTRRHNTAIHPARYTTEMMLKIKNNLVGGGQKRVWDALYQQNPVPDEGNYFSKEMFSFYSTAPRRKELRVYQAWDFAISTGKESDFTVGMCIGVDHRDCVYVLDVRRFRSDDGIMIVDTMLDYHVFWEADMLGVEDGQIWKALEAQFLKRCDERRVYPSFEVLKPLTDKMVRANPLRGRMQLKKVFFPNHQPWFQELQKEMLYFPAGKHDDQIDALAWSIRLMLLQAPPRQQDQQPKMKSWKDKLPGLMNSRGSSHMAA